jgi:branched-subunit amino acid aminotransferase/4-amino-4-deoxychorismate lyase
VELAEHLARLRESARTLRIALPNRVEPAVAAAIETLLSAERLDGADGDAAVRITVTHGASASRGLLPPAGRTDDPLSSGAGVAPPIATGQPADATLSIRWLRRRRPAGRSKSTPVSSRPMPMRTTRSS